MLVGYGDIRESGYFEKGSNGIKLLVLFIGTTKE